jgi:hypothetical protein
MSGPSFPLSLPEVVARSAGSGTACLVAALVLAGCGGGAKPAVTLRGDGFSFAAPGGWKVTRAGTSLTALRGRRAVSVTTFRLARPYSRKQWHAAVKELDGVAAKLAAELHGTVAAARTVTAGGVAARQYDLAFTKDGRRLVERTTFVLLGRREYQLLCRFEAGKKEPACALLERSFQPG